MPVEVYGLVVAHQGRVAPQLKIGVVFALPVSDDHRRGRGCGRRAHRHHGHSVERTAGVHQAGVDPQRSCGRAADLPPTAGQVAPYNVIGLPAVHVGDARIGRGRPGAHVGHAGGDQGLWLGLRLWGGGGLLPFLSFILGHLGQHRRLFCRLLTHTVKKQIL